MSNNQRKKHVASSKVIPISSQGTSAGEDAPLASVDSDQLLLRLSVLQRELHGQSTGVVERLCQGIADASQGHMQLVLLRSQYQSAQNTSLPVHVWLSLPVEHAGRTYGMLEIAPDPIRSDQLVLPYQKAQVVAMSCAVLLYSLETAAYLQREYISPVRLPVTLPPREQELLELMCHGYQREEIALMLGITRETIRKMCEKMYPRLGVHTEREAIAAAFRLGLCFPIEHLSAKIKLSPER